VFVNGEILEEPYVPPQFAEGGSFGPLLVPEGHYFLMGDHRSSSNDSRVFGPVPEDSIYGKAVFAYWPVERFGTLPAYADQR
jgi:signal peptidase I